jgi:hypothetical protein
LGRATESGKMGRLNCGAIIALLVWRLQDGLLDKLYFCSAFHSVAGLQTRPVVAQARCLLEIRTVCPVSDKVIVSPAPELCLGVAFDFKWRRVSEL